MTAYVNDEQKKEGAYGKAVKATLAATLAAGMVPAAAAFADEPAEAAEGNDVEFLVADGAFEKASIVKAYDNAGTEVALNANGKYGIAFTGAPHFINKVELKLADSKGETRVVEQGQSGYKFAYYNDVNGDGAKDSGDTLINSANLVQNDGNYLLVVTVDDKASAYDGQSVVVPFSIETEAAESNLALGVVTGTANGQPVIDTENIVFSGVQRGDAFGRDLGKIALTIDGKFQPMNSVKLYRAANVSAGAELQDTAVLYEGDYVAVVTYNTTETATVKFHVNAFDLSKANVTYPAVDKAPTAAIQAKNLNISGASVELKNLLAVTYKGDTPQVSISKKGAYPFSVAVDASKDTDSKDLARSITGSKDFTVNYVTALASFEYNGASVSDGQALDLKDAAFNPDKVTAEAGGKSLDGKFSVKVFDASGNEVDEWTAGGTYTVVAEVNDPTFATGGSVTFTFPVAKPEVKTDGIYVERNGELVSEIEKTYDGKDVAKEIAVKVVNGKKTMTEGVDYKLVYTNKAGKEVTEVVDADEYTLTVKPITFAFDNLTENSIKINVNKVQLADIRVANQITVAIPNEKPDQPDVEMTGLPYTGSAIVPVIEYKTGEKDAEGKDVYAKVPTDIYSLAYTNAKSEYIDEVVEPGAYRTYVTLNANVKNYEFASNASSCRFEVIKTSRFLDVPSSEWYYSAVNDAASKGWIKGYSGGDFFGPNDAITRADVCVSLARKAGIKLNIDENAGSEIEFVETPFEDVNGNMYYAQAIAWAAKTGIVTGDSDTGNFRPTDQISRQEFAAMTARFAEKMGKDITADASVLDDYADASSVAGWAKGYVAWAVENGIMGKDTSVLWPTVDITRAAVAAMLVRF